MPQNYGNGNGKQLVAFSPLRKQRELSLTFHLLFIQSRTPAHEMVPLTFKVTLYTSVNLIQTWLEICFHGNLNPIKLTRLTSSSQCSIHYSFELKGPGKTWIFPHLSLQE